MTGGLFDTEFDFRPGKTEVRRPTAAGVSVEEVSYDDSLRVTSRQTGAECTSTAYDERGDAVSEKVQGGQAVLETRRSFDGRHRVVGFASALDAEPNGWTRLSWDDRRGIPNRIVSPEGRVWEWTTNGHDVVLFGAGAGDPRLVSRALCTDADRPYALITPDVAHGAGSAHSRGGRSHPRGGLRGAEGGGGDRGNGLFSPSRGAPVPRDGRPECPGGDSPRADRDGLRGTLRHGKHALLGGQFLRLGEHPDLLPRLQARNGPDAGRLAP